MLFTWSPDWGTVCESLIEDVRFVNGVGFDVKVDADDVYDEEHEDEIAAFFTTFSSCKWFHNISLIFEGVLAKNSSFFSWHNSEPLIFK